MLPLTEKTLLGEAPRFVAELTVAGQAMGPAGSVQFRVNGIDPGAPVPLVDGRAVSAPIANLPAGDHDVSGRFLPAEGLLAGAARRTHTISQPTVVMVGSSANPSRPRKRVTFRAQVGPMAPGGTLSFAIDGRRIRGCQNVPVVHSTADCRLRKPRRGKRVVTVSYSGTHGYEPSTATFGQVVKPGRPKR